MQKIKRGHVASVCKGSHFVQFIILVIDLTIHAVIPQRHQDILSEDSKSAIKLRLQNVFWCALMFCLCSNSVLVYKINFVVDVGVYWLASC